jgi:ABC-type uncharacterized transport system substrate-binding protein
MLRLIALFVYLLLAVPAGAAARGQVLVVTGSERAAHAAVIEALQAGLALQPQTAPGIRVVDIDGFRTWLDSPNPGPINLIVTVGTPAARALREAGLRVPVLHTVIPRQTYAQLARTNRRDSAMGSSRGPRGRDAPVADSAIYLDQPFRRQLDLIRIALPKRKHLGAVLGPTSSALRDELQAAARARGFTLDIEQIETSAGLLTALNKVLEDNEVLLSVADSEVFNNQTVHHLLLSTYRHGVPVLGLSRAYVEAGALLAVHTTPEQIGLHLAEVLLKLAGNGQWVLPAPQPPRYFTVSVNRRVASALDLALPDETELLKKLQAAAAQQ